MSRKWPRNRAVRSRPRTPGDRHDQRGSSSPICCSGFPSLLGMNFCKPWILWFPTFPVLGELDPARIRNGPETAVRREGNALPASTAEFEEESLAETDRELQQGVDRGTVTTC